MRQSRLGFIHQQGFSPTHGRYAPYEAMMFQPRAVLVLLVLGTLIQNPWWFVTLSAVLWWCALVPAYNIFDAIYRVVADRQGLARIGPAPAPRRCGKNGVAFRNTANRRGTVGRRSQVLRGVIRLSPADASPS